MTKKFLALIVICYLLVLPYSTAATIYLHTDNFTDLKAFKSKNGTNNLSVSTNLHALNGTKFDTEFEYMTVKRSLHFMQNDKNICAVDKIKTKERLEKYIFSQPINLFLGRRLYQHPSAPPLPPSLANQQNINLIKLFTERPNSKILMSGQISYGDELDNQLALIPAKNKVVRLSSENDTGVINMFVIGRTDFALLYPQQVFKYYPNLVATSYELANSPPYVLGHIMCSKNPETQAFIEEINSHLSDFNNKEALLSIHLKFINPADDDLFEQYFRQVF